MTMLGIVIAAAWIAAPAAPLPNHAADIPESYGARVDEWSAARKKSAAKRQQPAVPQRRPWADPSFDEHGRLYQPPPGLPCPIDLGYGRWTSCSNR